VLPRRLVAPVRAGAITLIVLTALARVWTGAHWPSDVLGGVVLGTGYVAVTILAHRRLYPGGLPRLRRRAA
jgi:membrane-associated phospholipid phosphatase